MNRHKILCSIFVSFSLFSSGAPCGSETVQKLAPAEEKQEAPVTVTIDDSRLLTLQNLSSRNILFRQYCQDVELNYKNIFQSKKEEPQIFYLYRALQTDDLLSLASRLSIPYETIATLNRISATDQKIGDTLLYLPTCAGLFIAEKPSGSYEVLLQKEYSPHLSKAKYKYKIGGRTYYFLSNMRFSPTTRAFFVDTTMKLPLDSSILTSDYGYRVSPISNKWKFHSGVDLAAPQGTGIYACKRGKVTTTGYNSTYGNYIILLHTNGMTSVYAHLSKILVKQGQDVAAGDVIGNVGSTGASTGPHLHFEIRVNGSPTDPGKLISIE